MNSKNHLPQILKKSLVNTKTQSKKKRKNTGYRTEPYSSSFLKY